MNKINRHSKIHFAKKKKNNYLSLKMLNKISEIIRLSLNIKD